MFGPFVNNYGCKQWSTQKSFLPLVNKYSCKKGTTDKRLGSLVNKYSWKQGSIGKSSDTWQTNTVENRDQHTGGSYTW